MGSICYNSLESLHKDVERRRVKAIRADISGKADRVNSSFKLFREPVYFRSWLLSFLKDVENVHKYP